MGVFEMVVLIVLITTVGRILGRKAPRVAQTEDRPKLAPGEAEGIREALDDLSSRVIRLEEERDFYRDLLDAPAQQRGLPPSQAPGDSPGTT